MVGLKLLTVACLIASVYSSPHVTRTVETNVETVPNSEVQGKVNPGLGGALGGLVSGIVNSAGNIVGGVTKLAGNTVGNTLNAAGNIVNGVLGGNTQVGADVGLGGVFNPLIGALTGLTKNARSLLRDVANLKIPGAIDDVLNLLITVGASAGDIVNVILPGTGTALAQLVIGLLKILICTLGSPGLTGQLIGDRRPGYDNPRDVPAICGPNFGGKYGVKKYKGNYDNAGDVYNYYDLGDLDSKFRAALDKYTDGQGVNSLSGSQKYIVQWILQLTGLVKQHPNGDFSDDDIDTLATLLVQIIGGIGNSYQVGLGDKIAAKLVSYLARSTDGTTITINLTAQLPAIKKAINKCKPNDFGGAIKENNGDNNGNQNNSFVDVDGVNDQGTQTESQQNDQNDNNSQTQNNQQSNTDNNSVQQSENTQDTQSTTSDQLNQQSNTDNNNDQQSENTQDTQSTTSDQLNQQSNTDNNNDQQSENTQNTQSTTSDQLNQQSDANNNNDQSSSDSNSSQNTASNNEQDNQSNTGSYSSSTQEEGSQQDSETNAQNQQAGYQQSGQQVIQNGGTTTSIVYSQSNNNATSSNSSRNSSSSYKNSSSNNTQY